MASPQAHRQHLSLPEARRSADPVDAREDGFQQARLPAPPDAIGVQPPFEELRMGEHAVLFGGKLEVTIHFYTLFCTFDRA